MRRKKDLIERFNKKTEEFKVAARNEKIDLKKKGEWLKQMSSYFMLENMLEVIRITADKGKMFFEMKSPLKDWQEKGKNSCLQWNWDSSKTES